MSAGPTAKSDDGLGVDLLLLIAVQALWGVNWIFSKTALLEIPPLTLIVLRFLTVFVLFLPWMRWHRGMMLRIGLVTMTSGALNFGLGFMALTMAHDIAPLALSGNLAIPFATILSALFLGDRIGIWRGSALVVAFLGVAFMSFDPRIFSYWEAMLVNMAAAFAWATGAIFMRQTTAVHPIDMQGWIALGTWLPVGIAAVIIEPQAIDSIRSASMQAWACLAYVVIGGTLIAHVGFNWLVHRHPIPRLAPFLLLAPVIASVSGVIFLGDSWSWRLVAGGALTLSGVLIITLREARRRVAA
ncbi:MAG: DMT family transporter [Hyphomicrobiaceae bacterium]